MKLLIIFDKKSGLQDINTNAHCAVINLQDIANIQYARNDELIGGELLSCYVARHRYRIRAKTLELLSQIAKIDLHSGSIVRKLAIDSKASLFWPSPLGEKCNVLKSKWIDKLILLSMISVFVDDNHISEVITIGALFSQELQISQLFKNRSISVSHFPGRSKYGCLIAALKQNLYFFLSLSFQLALRPISAISWLLQFCYDNSRLPSNTKNNGAVGTSQGNRVLLVDYYCYLRYVKGSDQSVSPVYWGSLLQQLEDNNSDLGLLHHYIPRLSPAPEQCRRQISSLRSSSNLSQLFVESSQSSSLIFKAFCTWLKSLITLPSIAQALFTSQVPAARLALIDYIKWHSGPGCLKVICYYYMYKQIFRDAGCSSSKLSVVFLQENLDLEYMLLASIAENINIEAIGYPHSLVRFWDLRFFHLKSEFICGHDHPYPRYVPDKILANGPLNYKELASFYGNVLDFVDVEALRYEELVSFSSPQVDPSDDLVSILIISGIERQATLEIMDAAISAVANLSQRHLSLNFKLGLKLHPQLKSEIFESPKYSSIVTSLETQPLSEIAHRYTIAIIDSNTSAIVDTLALGLPSINYLGNRLVDLSPSPCFDGVETVFNADSLASSIESVYLQGAKPCLPDIFFSSDSNEKWLRLLRNC